MKTHQMNQGFQRSLRSHLVLGWWAGWDKSENHYLLEIKGPFWTCPVFVPLRLLTYAAFASKAKGLFQPSAECLRRGL